MQELIALLLGQFVVSLFMSLAALCLFLWAAASGQLSDVERVKYQVLEIEGIQHDERR
jgi:cbb3-type cytochrome oxidase maturation protein